MACLGSSAAPFWRLSTRWWGNATRGAELLSGVEDGLDVEDRSPVDSLKRLDVEGRSLNLQERRTVQADGVGAVGRAGGEDFGFEQVLRPRYLGEAVRASLGCVYVSWRTVGG